MAWTNPKTDWSAAYNPGPGDFNRIEGNIEHLKSNIAALESGGVMPKGALLRVVPSDAVILAANTQRSVTPGTGSARVKEFVLKYPGLYRFKCEVRGNAASAGSAVVSVSGGNSETLVITTTDWEPRDLEISTGLYGSVVRVTLRANNATVLIRNVRICGTLTMADPPEYAVLQN